MGVSLLLSFMDFLLQFCRLRNTVCYCSNSNPSKTTAKKELFCFGKLEINDVIHGVKSEHGEYKSYRSTAQSLWCRLSVMMVDTSNSFSLLCTGMYFVTQSLSFITNQHILILILFAALLFWTIFGIYNVWLSNNCGLTFNRSIACHSWVKFMVHICWIFDWVQS